MTKAGDKLRKTASGMQRTIDAKLTPTDWSRTNHTRKRGEQEEYRLKEGMRLQRLQHIMNTLADLQDNFSIPMCLKQVTTRNVVEWLFDYERMPHPDGLAKDFALTLNQSGINELNIAEAHSLIVAYGESANGSSIVAEADTKRKIQELTGRIPGFYPTPRHLIDVMLSNVTITTGTRILEPSAGAGHIVDAVMEMAQSRNLQLVVDCIEPNYQLQNILRSKGYNLVANTIENYAESKPSLYDVVLMNPPFENYQDIEHIVLATSMLLPGGCLVAICSRGSINNSTSKPKKFQEWLEDIGAYVTDIKSGEFREFGTMVASSMIVVNT